VTVEIRLEVDPSSDPIRGRLYDRRGEARDFQGWLQLMAALDTARSPEAEHPSQADRKGHR
jgi:hypothetical protein